MGWFKNISNADLVQSMELATSAAGEARKNGDKEREDAFHRDLDGMLEESERRGFPRWAQR